MRDKRKWRIDYSPCPAAKEALEHAQKLFPERNWQALIDKLVINGCWSLEMEQQRPPALFGSNRAYWRPAALQSSELI